MKTKTKPFQARQGDVLVESVAAIPNDAVKQIGRVILAHGEATGHAHEIAACDSSLWKRGEEVFVNVARTTDLKHQEHSPISLKRSVLKVTRQREYSPEEIRRVAD